MKFTKFPEIPQNLVIFCEICGISAFLRKNAIRAKMTKKCLPFCFIIATFWSVGEKRSPFSRNLQNFSKFAKFLKIHKILEISGNFSKFSKFQLFLRLLREWCPGGHITEAHTWKIPYVALRGGGGFCPHLSSLRLPPIFSSSRRTHTDLRLYGAEMNAWSSK